MVGALCNLRKLNIASNKLADRNALGALLLVFKELIELDVDANPCFVPRKSGTNARDRIRLLSHMMPDAARRGFPLKILNGSSLTIHERCKAIGQSTGYREMKGDVEDIRLDLTLEARQCEAQTEVLSLAGCSVASLSLLPERHSALRILDISNNKLRTLGLTDAQRRVSLLPNLEELRCGGNSCSSLDAMLHELRFMHKLKLVHLKLATIRDTDDPTR